MSEKIWFIYITDHHEGPFTPEEISEKASQGIVTPQSLVWKDGMAEWVALETVPELQVTSPTMENAAPQSLEMDSGAQENQFSLAQLLAKDQSGSAPEMVSDSAPNILETISTKPSISAPTEPGPEEVVWSLQINGQVSGLYSLNTLIRMASDGEVPAEAQLWCVGWTDFQPVTRVPKVASARRPKKAGFEGTKTGMTKSFSSKGIMPISGAGPDEVTDTGIVVKPSAIAGFLEKIKAIFPKKKPAAKAPGKFSGTKPVIGKHQMGKKQSKVAGLLKIGIPLLLIAGAGGGAYLFLFSSPIPSSLDVSEGDLDAMKIVVKTAPEQGKKFHFALARGTEDNPADDTNPKFYIATNLTEGSVVKLSVVGVTGTLVNRISFSKTFTANVSKAKLAVFEQISDDGKPIPMGEYVLKIEGDGAAPLEITKFLGGKKGAVYDRRLHQYKEKMQADYDKEMQELREYIGTLRNSHTELLKKIVDTKNMQPSQRAKFLSEWRVFYPNFQNITGQIDQKIKARIAAQEPQKFYARIFQDTANTLGQLIQLGKIQAARMEGAAAAGNSDETEGLTQAGILSLEQWLATALVKNPFDALKANESPSAVAPKK